MNLIFNKIFLEHDTGSHPENRRRLQAFTGLTDIEIEIEEHRPRLIHSKRYINHVRRNCAISASMDPDTYTSPRSFETALYAVEATIMAAQRGDFAIVRPPGHHAFPEHSSGFCLFNNVAIATQMLVQEGKRVLILDFDGHLGDGTCHIFYEVPEVMYWTMHQYPAFPGHGFVYEIGEKAGEGYTVNIPLPPGAGDDIADHALRSFLPIAEQFEPDVVAVSAGFDSHQYDPLLQLKFSLNAFYKIGVALTERFGSIFATLEGGYNPDVLTRGIYNFVAGINQLEMPYWEEPTISGLRVWEEYEANANAALAILSNHWKV